MNKLSVAPIQDEKGILHFSQEGRSYTLNVNSKEERERVKNEINANSLTEYEWFKEKRGKKHWVLYNTEMYEIIGVSNKYLHYKELCSIVPTIPINATSCRYIFHNCSKLTQLDLSIFNTSRITDMFGMFSDCTKLTKLDLSNFNTSNVTNMSFMFCNSYDTTELDLSSFDTRNVENMACMFDKMYALKYLNMRNFNTERLINMDGMFNCCVSLVKLDLTSFDTGNVLKMAGTFNNCKQLEEILVSDKWSVCWGIEDGGYTFYGAKRLPNYNPTAVGADMGYDSRYGGYLTIK